MRIAFKSATEYCIRVCVPAPNDRLWCNHIYDVLGCNFNFPGDYSRQGFDQCLADVTSEMPGRNGTYRQGEEPYVTDLFSRKNWNDADFEFRSQASPSSPCRENVELSRHPYDLRHCRVRLPLVSPSFSGLTNDCAILERHRPLASLYRTRSCQLRPFPLERLFCQYQQQRALETQRHRRRVLLER